MDKDFEIVEAVITDSRAKGTGAIPPFRKKDDGFTRQDIVNAFGRAFQMVGGTERLALWANANPDKFFPLMTKLFPSQAIAIGMPSHPVVEHALPPTPLDTHPGYEPPTVVQPDPNQAVQ